MPVPTHVPAPPTDVMSWSPQGRGRAGAKVAKSLVPYGGLTLRGEEVIRDKWIENDRNGSI